MSKPPERPWLLNQEEVTIVKNSIAKGASDEELKFCLTVARRYRLDPFKQQIWFVKRWDSAADNGQGGKGANVWTPQVGINGLLFAAARDHKPDYGSVSLPEYGPMIDVSGIKAPEWAIVKVWKRGETEPTEAQAWWNEYAPADLSKAPFWRKMPRRMIGKCATALAIRQAYPDLGGLYIPEECERINEDSTPSGRQIVGTHEVGGSLAAAQAVAQRKIAEHAAKQKTIDAQPVGPPPTHSKAVEVWFPSKSSEIAYVRGDIATLVPLIQKNGGEWRDALKTWEIKSDFVPDLEMICKSGGFQFKQVSGLPSPKPEAAKGERQEPPSLVVPPSGLVSTVRLKEPKGKNPHMEVNYAGLWIYAFDAKMFPFLSQAQGKECSFNIIKASSGPLKISGIKKIGKREFDEDGITPIIQKSEERPTTIPSLFS